MYRYLCTWKNTELIYTSFGTVKHLAETVSADLDKTTRLLFYIYVVHECHHSKFTSKNSNTPRL